MIDQKLYYSPNFRKLNRADDDKSNMNLIRDVDEIIMKIKNKTFLFQPVLSTKLQKEEPGLQKKNFPTNSPNTGLNKTKIIL